MKTHLFVPVCLLFTVTALHASPFWTSNRDEEYILSSDKDLSRLSMGFNLERNDRELTYRWPDAARTSTDTFQFQRYKAYLGFDVLPWLTLYGTGGGCRIAVGVDKEEKAFETGNTEYGAGLRLNILDHIILDPFVTEDRIRLTATVQYIRSSFELEYLHDNPKFNWFERRSTIQLSIVNDIPGSPWFRPESVALNLGLVYSDIEGDHELNQVDAGWATLGLEIFYSKRISFDGSIYFSNNNETRGMNAGFHLRF